MHRELNIHISPAETIAPALYDATVEGDSVDLAGFSSAAVLIHVGAWTDGTHTFEVQHSDDDDVFTAVPDTQLDGTEPVVDDGDTDGTLVEIGYNGSKRYLRVVNTVTDNPSDGLVAGAVIVRGHPRRSPVA